MRNLTKLDELYTKDGRLNAAILRREWFNDTSINKDIIASTKFLADDVSFSERIHCYKFNIGVLQLCECCNTNPKNFNPYDGQYGKYLKTCNNKRCAATMSSQKRIDTCLKKYGTKVSTNTINSARERSSELNRKGRATLQERYGVANPGQLDDHWDKCKSSMIDVHGVDHYSKIPSIIIKRKMMQFKNWQEKVSSTNIEFIGVTEPSQLKKILFESPNNNIEFKCNNCGSVESLPSETVKWRLKNLKTICTKCSGISIGSAAQLNVINFIKEHYHGEIIVNDKSLIHPYELDIYIPGLKLAIEYDGLFWHSHCSMESKDEREYHLRKTEQCEKHGIQLIHIFENEWVLKTDIVKSRIKHLLGVSDCIIYARKCKVIEISSLDSKDFLDKNHIQGNCQASVKLGMYHQSKLVAVMTFGKSRFNKKYEWELLRYSSACNCSVVGGAGKLISYFKKSYTPRNVISFADRRWSLGKLYKKLGFDFLHDSAPNFWYWKKNGLHLESRIKYQKYKLKDLLKNYDESMSASTNMFSNGFRRIWDCGNKVYALNL